MPRCSTAAIVAVVLLVLLVGGTNPASAADGCQDREWRRVSFSFRIYL